MPPWSSIVMEHFQDPQNAGVLSDADAVGKASVGGHAPYMTLFLRIDEGQVQAARFKSFGCGYSIAAGSMLTVLITGRTLAACQALTTQELERALGGLPQHKRFCAQLAINAMHNGLEQYRNPK